LRALQGALIGYTVPITKKIFIVITFFKQITHPNSLSTVYKPT
jgi:hypothetical protein